MLTRPPPWRPPMKNAHRLFPFFLVIALVVQVGRAAEPLHSQIDQMLSESFLDARVPIADDATYVRRIYVSLTGRVPTIEQTRQFVADAAVDKRAKLVDVLLESPFFARHMAVTFDVMIMERRADKHVKAPEWRAYLLAAFQMNQPLNELAAQILAADGVDPALRPAAKFYLDRDGEANLLTRDVGRIFFGVDLQCAQCHDHPIIDSYYQLDYYGLNTFFNRGFVFTDAAKKISFYAEKTEGVTAFKSVFTEEEGTTGPIVPDGFEMIEPLLKTTEAYTVAPAKDVMPVPKHVRRDLLSEFVKSGKSHAFNRNMANRLWAHMFGIGLVDPVDLHHDDNPPIHAPLLSLLSQELATTQKFDIRSFLRELALTAAYQRAFESPQAWDVDEATLKSRHADLERQLAELSLEKEAFEVQISVERVAALAVEDEFRTAKTVTLESIAKHTKAAAAFDKANVARETVSAAVTKNETIGAELAVAFAKSKSAVELVDDAELTGIIGILDKRSKAALAAAEKQRPDLNAKTTASETAQKAADVASQEVDQKRAVHDEAAPKLVAAQAKLAPLFQTDRELRHRRELLDRQLKETTLTLSYQQNLADLAAAEARVPVVESEMTKLSPLVSQSADAINVLRLQFDAAEKKHLLAKQTLLSVENSLKKKESAKMLLFEAQKGLQETLSRLDSAGAGETTAILKDYVRAIKVLGEQVAALKLEAAEAKTFLENQGREMMKAAGQLKSETEKLAVYTTKQRMLKTQLDDTHAQLKGLHTSTAEQYNMAVQAWSRQGSLASLQPLAPEEMAWSVLVATGVAENYRVSAIAELKKAATEAATKEKTPLPAEGWSPERFALEAAIDKKLEGAVKGFVPLFGAGAGQPQGEFFATVDQALYVANGGAINGWLSPSGNNLTARLNKLLDQPEAFADELYESVLSRKPTAAELKSVSDYLASSTADMDQKQVSRELVWALLASVEFRFNH
jgi:hypothetical protein